MIDYSRIKDPEYVNSLISDIRSTENLTILNDLIKNISTNVAYHRVSYDDVSNIINAIKHQTSNIITAKRNQSHNQAKSLSLSPVGSNNHHRTAISDSRGVASLLFIIVNIAITTVMYTLLLIANFIK